MTDPVAKILQKDVKNSSRILWEYFPEDHKSSSHSIMGPISVPEKLEKQNFVARWQAKTLKMLS
jgi:hypothetical protein